MSSFLRVDRRRGMVALLVLGVTPLLGLGGLLVVTATPASGSIPCGNNGVFSVNGSNLATCTYTTLGADTFTVPPNDNTTSLSIVVVGAGGAGGTSTANGLGTPDGGGSGARVTNTSFAATANDVFNVEVGGGGQPAPTDLAEGGGGASSSVIGTTSQIIAGGGGGGGSDSTGGNAGTAGGNAPGCTDGGGAAGSGGTGGVATSASCNGGGAAQSGGNGNGGPGGSSVEGGTTDVGAGGSGSGLGFGGHSYNFSGGAGGGYGGGAGGAGGGGGGGGGSTGGSVALASNAGTGGAIKQQTPGGAGGNGSVTISYQIPLPPTNNTAPTITGTAAVGQPLTCNTADADWNAHGVPIDEFRYEFFSGGSLVQGPSQLMSTYDVVVTDAGNGITCSVSASNIGGPSAFVGSSNSIPIPVAPVNNTLPNISGIGTVGDTLTCNTLNADWSPTPNSFTYQFFNGGTSLGAASATDTLLLADADAGDAVSCQVVATGDGGPSLTASSSNSIAVTAPLTITAPSPTINYGQAIPTLTPIYTGLINGDVATSTPPTCHTTPPTPIQAGTYPVACSGAADSDYTISYAPGTFTIDPVPLTVTAPSATVLDSTSPPAFVPHYAGFVAGDTASSLSTPPTCTTTYVASAFPLPLPGSYPVTCAGAVDHNYQITYVAGSLTVYLTALPGAVNLVGPDGGVFTLGSPDGFHGSLPGLGIHVHDIAGITATPDDKGYYLVGRDGGVFAFGDAIYRGSLPSLGLHVSNIVGLVATPDNKGYYLVGKDGGVFTFGDAVYQGSLPGKGQSVSDVVDIALTPDGGGYWLAQASGVVDNFGDAPILGDSPSGGIVSITATQSGGGYWLTSASGGVFNFGNAPFRGALPGLGLTVSNIVTTVASPNGGGYLIVGADGGTFAFPNEVYPGSMAGSGLTFVGAAPTG